MPSLEQIIRPFVVDPTLPPAPYITTNNDPAPDLVRLNIGIGGTSLASLSTNVAPVIKYTGSTSTLSTKPTIMKQETSSSYSMSITWYKDEKVHEETSGGSGGGFRSLF